MFSHLAITILSFNGVTKIIIIFKDNFIWALVDAKIICKNKWNEHVSTEQTD